MLTRHNQIVLWFFRQNPSRRAEFYEALADSIADGMPQLDVLQKLRKYVSNNDPIAIIIDYVMHALRGGSSRISSTQQRTVGTELKGLLPDVEVSMIVAGEFSGQIEQGWRNAAHYARKQQEMRGALFGSIAKPTMYFVGLVALLLFFSFQIFPKFNDVSPRSKWPPLAQNIGWMADNILWIVVFMVGFVILGGVITGILNVRWTGEWRHKMDQKIPPFSLLAGINGSGFILGLASFLGAGVSFGDSLARMRQSANPYMRWQISRIEAGLRRGLRPEEAILKTSLVPQRYAWLVAIYGSNAAAKTAQAYSRIASEMSRKTQQFIQNVVGSVISNAILFLIAVSVILIYSAIFSIVMSTKTI